MKRAVSMVLSVCLVMSALAGCSSKKNDTPTAKTPEELTTLYASAITENGGESVEYNPVVSAVSQEDSSAMMLEFLGLKEEDMTAFGLSISLMNVQAYGIAAVMPAEGKEEDVKKALQGYIDQQKTNFEFYLADQYEIAKSARLETLEDGTVLMVICEDQDAVFDAISAAIQKG